MKRKESVIAFKLMSWCFRIRDFFIPRINILREIEIKPGYQVLDYGCGPGSYVIGASQLVGSTGRVYALDANKLAVQKVEQIILNKNLVNVSVIHSDCKTKLPDSGIDVLLLFDVLHELNDINMIFEELHRILKPDGMLIVSDHHLEENNMLSLIINTQLFKFSKSIQKILFFCKAEKTK